MVLAVPFVVTGTLYYVKGKAGIGMRNGRNVGEWRKKHFADSIQDPE